MSRELELDFESVESQMEALGAAATLPPLPVAEHHLPSPIREEVEIAPESRKQAVFFAATCATGPLMGRARFDYVFDQRPHMPVTGVVIEGEPSVGKGFLSGIHERIIGKTFSVRDAEARAREMEWREKFQRKSANKQAEPQPQEIIRELPPSTTKAILIKRTDIMQRKFGDVLPYFQYAEELQELTDAGKNSYGNLRLFYRAGYDYGSKTGSDAAFNGSTNAIVDVNIASLYAATPYDVDQWFDKKSIVGGLCTRSIVIPLEDDGEGPAIFKKMTAEQTANQERMLEKLMSSTYTAEGDLQEVEMVDMGFLERDVKKWCAMKTMESKKGKGKSYYVFMKRSSVSAFRMAGICRYCYELEGIDASKAERYCRKIYRWAAEIIHRNMLARFGKTYDDMMARRENGGSGVEKKSLFEMMGEVFTRRELEQQIAEGNYGTDARIFLSQWKSQGWIEILDKQTARKTGKK